MSGESYLLLSMAFAALLAAPCTAAVVILMRRWRHQRLNFEGRDVANSGGLALIVPLLVAVGCAPVTGRLALMVCAAALAFAALGWLDDRFGNRAVGGFKGHFGSLLRGKLTTGAVKALGGAAVALVVAAELHSGWGPVTRSPAAMAGWAGRIMLSAALIALAANGVNLLDLRPLRGLKGYSLAAAPLWIWGLGAPGYLPVEAALGSLLAAGAVYGLFEARRKVMLGDAGANLLGATAGFAAAARLDWPGQAVCVALLLALHLYSEKHSISTWIQAHPWVDRVDRWGWK